MTILIEPTSIENTYEAIPNVLIIKTIYLTSVTSGAVVPDVVASKILRVTSVTTSEIVPAVSYVKFLPYAGNAAEINVSGFASFTVESVTPGAGFVGSRGRGNSPAIAFAEVNAMNIRAIPNTLITMPDPIIFNGLPRVPMAHSVSDAEAEVGTTIARDDPDDDDDEFKSNLHRFKVGTLASPSGGEYWLEEWEEADGSLAWNSVYPYRPWVQHRSERLTDHTNREYTRSLHFNNRYVEHMWLDLGASHSALTVIIAATFHGYHSSEDGHYVLDAGRATPVYSDVVDGDSHEIDDNLDYRAAMIYKKHKSLSGTSDRRDISEGVHIQAKHDDGRKPKVMFSVFNGDDSMHGTWDMDSHKVRYGKMQPKSIRRLVLGRARNQVDRDYCSDMTVFEILIYKQALTWEQIRKRAKRLGGRYKFDKHWD